VRAFKPDVIQGWMYHGNLAAQAARLAAPRAKVVLGIHQTLARLELESRATRAVIRLDALLSRFAARVLYVAEAAVAQHEAAGYAARSVVLPNGIDTALYCPDPVARAATRAALGLGDEDVLIGMLGRFHPAKNHVGFLQAAALVLEAWPQARVLLAGAEVTPENPALAPLLNWPILRDKVFALGPREDVPALLAACDLYVLSSIQEALPNVVMEAMSCGLPCVVTEVGDAGRMIAGTGWVSPLCDGEALAEIVCAALGEGPLRLAERGRAARSRAQTQFAADGVAQRYAVLYRGL
jgi:glycosyltransferase involved in cell wall biosynthesis